MTAPDPLPGAVLRRKAVVYVRQSTPAQVQVNVESRRRQYELVEVARRRGFREIEVIDDYIVRSAGGAARLRAAGGGALRRQGGGRDVARGVPCRAHRSRLALPP